MKRIFLSVFLMLVLCAAVYSQDSMDQRVAIVNLSKSEIISRKQLDQTIKVLQHAGVNKSEQEVLEVMVEDVLLRQAAEKEGIQVSEAEILSAIRKEVGAGANVTDEQLKDFVEQRMNVSWTVYSDRSKTTLAVQRYIRKVKGSKLANVPSPSDDEVKRFYDENTKQFFVPKRVTLDHIYVDTRGLNSVEQQKALERINGYSKQIGKSSAEFEKVVELSDDSASKYNHGRFGTLRIDDSNRRKFMGEDFFDTVFNMHKGDISSVIKSNVGYHIVRIVNTEEPRLLGLNEKVSDEQNVTVKDTIVQYLTAKKQDAIFKECVREVTDDLKKKATIKYFL
jgi:parvulin-like peptidyl-prolyl isomerase